MDDSLDPAHTTIPVPVTRLFANIIRSWVAINMAFSAEHLLKAARYEAQGMAPVDVEDLTLARASSFLRVAFTSGNYFPMGYGLQVYHPGGSGKPFFYVAYDAAYADAQKVKDSFPGLILER